MTLKDQTWRNCTLEEVVSGLPDLGVQRSAEYWRTKAPAKEIFFYGTQVSLRSNDRTDVTRISAGEIQTYTAFPWTNLGMPPAWDGDCGIADPTWDFYRHCLRWTEPLLRVWRADSAPELLRLWLLIIRDWSRCNLPAPGASKFAWFDHAGANRLRLLCWAWEQYRQHASFNQEIAEELLALIYVHARFMSDPETYPGHSNHGLEMTGALLSAAVTTPEFREAQGWLDLGVQRLQAYVEHNFSDQGFHLEQSPFYHFYVLDRLNRTIAFLSTVGVPVPANALEVVERVDRAGIYLCKPDGVLPTLGDTPSMKPVYQRRERPAERPASLPPPQRVIACYRSGYAVLREFTERQPRTDEVASYLLFKCNSFWSPHFHHDALSFTLYALGRDWLVDAGQYSYDEKSLERRHVRSARAHSTLIVDGQPFGIRPVALIGYGHTDDLAWVEAEHSLEQATHRRRIELVGHDLVVLTDDVAFTDSREHTVEQQFLLAPDLDVTCVSGRAVEACDPAQRCCSIDWLAQHGEVSIARGQREPYMLGWYAPSYGNLLPTSTVVYTRTGCRDHVRIVTRLALGTMH